MEEAGIYDMADKPNQQIIRTVKEYGKRLFGFIRKRVKTTEEAEDILQEVWYQLSNIIDLDSIDHMSGWLFRVARNKITDNYRKKKPETLEDYYMGEEGEDFNIQDILASDDPSAEEQSLRDMFWEELFLALDELPENQRQVYIWNELEDMTLREIADQTGENLKTIISRKRYAVQHLRKKLEDLYNDIINY
jgi:RNA polymerase sigma factor (sigma-70 family)